MMKCHVNLLGLLLVYGFSISYAHSQTVQPDSISKVVNLKEVLVISSNMKRMDNYILIRPTAEQRNHSSNAFELLSNCNIPTIKIDQESGTVESQGAPATLYMNGLECDARDLSMLRPRDIEKIEYHDIPAGKYAKDKTAINFVVKQYQYGGYVQVDAQQTIGYSKGVYDLAANLNHLKNTYSVFAGIDYTKLDNMNFHTEECLNFSNPISRVKDAESTLKQNNDYVQLRFQHQGKHNYLTTKLTLVNSDMPSNTTDGNVEGGVFSSSIHNSSLSPKFDLVGEYKFTDRQSLTYGAHFKYDRNKYARNYMEDTFRSDMNEYEDAYSFKLSCIYTMTLKDGTLTGEIFHYHNIWDSRYSESTSLWQHLWKGESLAFLTYSRPLASKLTLYSRIGLDWLQYSLHHSVRFSQFTPRANLRLQYRIPNGNLMFSANYMNSNQGVDVLNNAEVAIDKYLTTKGNPDLKKSHDFSTNLYYTQEFGNLMVTSFSEYNFCHNNVMNDFSIQADKVIKSFSNDADTHQFTEIIGASYSIGQNLTVGGDMRYAHYGLVGKDNMHINNLTGSLDVSYYWHDFAIEPTLSFSRKALNFRTLEVMQQPIDYGARLSYSHQNLNISMYMASPFHQRTIKTTLETLAYDEYNESRSKSNSQYCNLLLTYTFDFGRKTKTEQLDLDKSVNSALLSM